jgi:hypothetical protein
MKRIAPFVFVILPLLLMTSCASAPNWSGTETANGEFIWTQSPGIRFYVNVIVLGSLLALGVFRLIKPVKNENLKGGERIRGMGCLALILVLFGYLLWNNIDQNTRTETYLINSERIQAAGVSIEWNNIVSCEYFSGKSNVVEKRMVVGGTRWETGDTTRSIILRDQNKRAVSFLVENASYDTSITGTLEKWIFGSYDYNFSPEEELRLKKAINKYLSENVKQNMPSEAKEYLSMQE